MNKEHKQQMDHIDDSLEVKVHSLMEKMDYNTKLTENLMQQISGVGSDLKAFKKEMKPWLEAKIGLNLIWRWAIAIPVVVATLVGIKTLLAWIGFHK